MLGMLCIIPTLENDPRGRGKKRCHFPPEGDTIGNAITQRKLGMLTYITMGINVCPSEWYKSAKFRVLAHALKVAGNFTTPKLTIEKGWKSNRT